jgi:transcription-repair coupling factor (superfamily II helicase)
VNHKGELALRGGILDVFPPTSPWPVRMEFFGNELESLRYFDPLTQISSEAIQDVTISPAGEVGILKKQVSAQTGEPLATLVDYLPPDAIFIFSEPERLRAAAETYSAQVPEGDPFFVGWEEVLQLLESRLQIQLEGNIIADVSLTESDLSLPFQNLELFRPVVEKAPEIQVAEAQRREFFGQLHRWLRQNYAVHLFCNNEGERDRFLELWTEYGFDRDPANPAKPILPRMHLGALGKGFIYDEAKLVVLTDAEIFGRYKIQRPRRLKSYHAQQTRSLLQIDFGDLEEGDFVVHIEHGIGRYLGLQLLDGLGGLKPLEKASHAQEAQECLVIEYASQELDQPSPRLYVPVSEAHLVSKYVGAGKARPTLNTLGGGRWKKAKEQAERAVLDLAAELLATQAARESQSGHSFGSDNPWQREFENAFIYEETPDQVRAIVQTKADMEKAKPMDRLICGDVGFGKTEVAIRAAFKAVMGGKQVALLVPTTILAQQHFNTFLERMADYPIRIELLSRFRSTREQRTVLQALQAGGVDIVIGTHRLVQHDVAFKDLGLVIIDEEQRFGVMQKEKFKLLRQMVDVLTLSATPIPRTLYLALTGARDMSTIETPPQDRLPVQTIVTQYDERIIRDAIQRELNRQGQVYFLHNRVSTIDTIAEKLRALLPKARIVIGHGQMEADDLEQVMTEFVNGNADVLLSTTIIESGLDIPNANTIIIDRADRFGLSDLYQLRGRVGRYKHQAYAYLLLPRHAGLLTDARKRISAIKQYSTLGSGFKIAMRDLEIRGAGNLLGAQQSGHITAVGFDLYCQLLKQSVSALKGEKVAQRIDVQVRLDFLPLRPGEDKSGERGRTRAHAAIPISYVADAQQRIQMYRKIAEATDLTGLTALKKEFRDRFGPVPRPVELLLDLADLKITAASKRVTAIETQEEKIMITRLNDLVMAGGKFPRLTKTDPRARLKEIKQVLLALA